MSGKEKTRACSKCGERFPHTRQFFGVNHGRIAARCRVCTRTQRRERARQHREDNRDRARELKRGRDRRYREKNRATWREANRVVQARRRARKKGAGGYFSQDDIQRMLISQGRRCWWCGDGIKGGAFHIDHRVPLAGGGDNELANIVISCPRCNLVKGDRCPQSFCGRLL